MAAAQKSHKRDNAAGTGDSQGDQSVRRVAAGEFSLRFLEALEGHSDAEISRVTGIPKQTIGGFKRGSIPSADRALLLADALGVSFRWLIFGVGEPREGGVIAESDSVRLPVYDPSQFEEYGRGRPREEIDVPRSLLGTMKGVDGLWLTEMPSDALPSVAQEGQIIICRPPDPQIQDRRVYIFSLDGRIIVRRAFVRPEGLLLKGETEDDTVLVKVDDLGSLIPVARVLGPLGFNPV